MMTTLSFKELAKKIHPDHNPDILDPGTKMRLAIANRHNETALYGLAIQWGIIKVAVTPQSPRTHSRTYTAPPRDPEYDAYMIFRRKHRIFQPGDVVYCRTKGARVVVTRVTDDRVYFDFNGKASYAMKKNVRFI
jgi:hypothetical protein